MNGSELLAELRRLHHLSPSVLRGSLDRDSFMEQLRTWFQNLRSAMSPSVWPGEDDVDTILHHLEQVILAEIALDALLLPRYDETRDIAAKAEMVLGLFSASILDTQFQRLAILCELIGLQDGSVSFPEETYWVYRYLRTFGQYL